MDTIATKYRDIAFWIIAGAILLATLILIRPFLPAILWAIVLSVLMHPYYLRLRKRFNENSSALIATLSTILLIGLPLFVVAVAVVLQVNMFIRDMLAGAPPGHEGLTLDNLLLEVDRLLAPFTTRFGDGDFSLAAWVQENREALTRGLGRPVGQALFAIGFGIFSAVIAFLSMFFMLRDGHRLRGPALELIPLPEEESEHILNRLRETIRAVFVGVVLVAFVQGTVAGVTYHLVGVPNALMWGVFTIILCTIPLMGAPLIYIPLAITLAAQGHYIQAAILLGVGFIFVSNIDNLLRPFIIGARVPLHPIAIFFSLLGGVLMMGAIGIFAGPLLLAAALAVQDVIRLRLARSREPLPVSDTDLSAEAG
jgi:predicted PurR-regulated permease PerM